MATINGDLADSFRTVPLIGVTRLQFSALAETFGTAGALSLLQGVRLVEAVRLSESCGANQKSQLTLTETLRILAQLWPATPVTISEGFGIAQSETIQRAVSVLERLGVADATAGAAIYRMTLADVVRVSDALGRFFGVDIAEGFGILEALAGRKLAPATIAETIGLGDALNPTLLISVVMDESVEISAEFALCMLYDAQILEGVEVSALYLSPGGGFNTWVMNTRTGGVTEYDNFHFNSFAQLGHTYLAAADDGLYELVGDTDAGADITARIKGGFLQFGGPQLSRLKAAYIAVRGAGDFVLKIETGEGDEYHYSVTTQSMHTAKVHMGKGMRARYFSYELISTGQDFDLDTLEFVPIVMQRRV